MFFQYPAKISFSDVYDRDAAVISVALRMEYLLYKLWNTIGRSLELFEFTFNRRRIYIFFINGRRGTEGLLLSDNFQMY